MTESRKQQYILYAILFQVLLGFGMVIPILPFFVKQLGASDFYMGLLVTVWAGAQFMFSPVWGALSDRIGRRPVLLIGLAGYALTFGLMAVSHDIWMALLARFLGGMLSAATIPTAQAYIADISTKEERPSRMAAMGAAMNLGFIAGPSLGGLLAGLGYNGLFAVSGGLAMVTWVLAFAMLPEPPKRADAPAARKGFSGLKAVSIALAGPESLLFLLAFAGTFGGSAMFSMLGNFLISRMDANESLLGIAFTVEGVAAVIFQTFLVSRLSRSAGEEKSVGYALLSGSLGFLVLIFSHAFWQVVIGLIFISLCISLMRPLVTSMVSQRTRMEQGVTMGIQTAFDALGRSIGPLWAGAAFLWRDWAPFASAIAMYMLFFFWTQAAWRKPRSESPLA